METWVIEQISTALSILAEAREELDPATASLVDPILAHRDDLTATVDRLAEATTGTLLTRNHGDFHLGQIPSVGG